MTALERVVAGEKYFRNGSALAAVERARRQPNYVFGDDQHEAQVVYLKGMFTIMWWDNEQHEKGHIAAAYMLADKWAMEDAA